MASVGRLVNSLWQAIKARVFFFRQLLGFVYSGILQNLIWRWWLGYGERPWRVLAVIILVLTGTWLAYWLLGDFVLNVAADPPATGHQRWHDALYYSLISFSALGYGGWAPEPTGWAKWIGAIQPFFGIVSAVALSITITQRLRR